MTSSLITGLALIVGVAVLISSVAYGILGYNPERAQAIREREAEPPVVIEEIRRIRVTFPDRFRRGRIDRHPFYIGVHLAAFGYSICILSGSPVTSNVSALSESTRLTMGCQFLVGAALVLMGAAMGAKLFRWRILGGVHDNIASARLGDDIRLPYTFGATGMFCMGISTSIYATTSFGSTLGSLGGWLTALIAGACVAMLTMFVMRIRQYSRTLAPIVNQAVAAIVERGGDDTQ